MGWFKSLFRTVKDKIEGFEGTYDKSKGRTFVIAIVWIVFLILHLIIGKYLWNNALVPLVPAVKPASSVWQVLGVTGLLSILMPN